MLGFGACFWRGCCYNKNRVSAVFRRSYRKNEVIEENKALLKEKYTAAKSLGKQVSLTSPRP